LRTLSLFIYEISFPSDDSTVPVAASGDLTAHLLRTVFRGPHSFISRHLKLLNRIGKFHCLRAEILKEVVLNQDLQMFFSKFVQDLLLLRVLRQVAAQRVLIRLIPSPFKINRLRRHL
jgi:hypothetical protein